MTSDFSKSASKLSKIEKSIKKFEDLLANLDNVDSKLITLWTDVYRNAVKDRDNANSLYEDLAKQLKGSVDNHGLYGAVASKYLERMCRSNDQILRLAEMIERTQREEAKIDEDSIFSQINESSGG